MNFSKNLKSRVKSYFKEKYDLDLLDSEIVDILDNLSGLYLAFTSAGKESN